MAQTVVVKKSGSKPQDRKPKAEKPRPLSDGIDLGDEDTGPVEFPVHFLKDDEETYQAHLPKGTLALALGEQMNGVDTEDLSAMREMVDRFIRLLFFSDTVDRLTERLDDPDDRLDLVHFQRLIQRIAERSADLPTT